MNGPVDVARLYERFFELGGPPPGDRSRPWNHRRKVTSLRLPGALVLAELFRERRPARVLDLGSGFTSILLRSLVKFEAPESVVITTDLSPHWLAVTVKELIRDGLEFRGCALQQDFEAINSERFDLVSVDIGDTAYRLTLPEKLERWLAPGGVVFLDDWHLHTYPTRMTAALEAAGFVVTVRPGADEYGGRVAVAERRP